MLISSNGNHVTKSASSMQIGSWLLPSLCILFLAGCGGGSSLVKVSGKVTVDGVPADGAVLLFHPESSENTNVSTALADSNGVFSPVTGADEGIPAGRYRVTLTWPDPKARAAAGTPQFGQMDTRDPPDLLKGKFVALDRTTLSVVIERSTVELEPFELSN